VRTSCVSLVLVVLARIASAQPAPCGACSRGDALIERYSLQPLRTVAGELGGLALGDPLTPDQYARVIDARRRTPALARLGAVDDEGLTSIAAALCGTPNGSCVNSTTYTLRCLADRCTVLLPDPPANRTDLVELPATCHAYRTRKRTSPIGLGFDWGNGWQRSAAPTDGRAWSLGIDARMRIGRRFGAVARVDRVAGRDEATDVDGDGSDDMSTGSITRISMLAGPSIVLDNTRFEDTTRFVRLDLLGGYVATRTQPNESGPAAGLDLSFQLAIFRLGARVVQGFGEASDATMVLGHIGLIGGSTPPYGDAADCGASASARSSRLAIGIDFPITGYGISGDLGLLATGLAFEAFVHVSRSVDVTARADLLLYPGEERDRVIHQAALAGLRLDHLKPRKRRSGVGFFTTLLGGYTHGAGFTPSTAGSGPVVDLAVGWGIQEGEGAANLRLHGRFGVSPDNLDYRAIFLSGALELRFDPSRWMSRFSP
jgi:hypothetical protein